MDADEAPDYDVLMQLFRQQLTDEELENRDLGIFDADKEPNKAQLEAQLLGKVINGTFEIRNFVRDEFAAFIHDGLCFITIFTNSTR